MLMACGLDVRFRGIKRNEASRMYTLSKLYPVSKCLFSLSWLTCCHQKCEVGSMNVLEHYYQSQKSGSFYSYTLLAFIGILHINALSLM